MERKTVSVMWGAVQGRLPTERSALRGLTPWPPLPTPPSHPHRERGKGLSKSSKKQFVWLGHGTRLILTNSTLSVIREPPPGHKCPG